MFVTIAIATFALFHVLPVRSQCPDGWIEYVSSSMCVKFFGTRKIFVEAMEYCENIGKGYNGNLVSIHNAFQNGQVAALVDETGGGCSSWIGLSDLDGTGTYVWTDGSAVDYQNWASGFPVPNQECSLAYMSKAAKQKWESSSGFLDSMCFVCQQLNANCEAGWTLYNNACYYKGPTYSADEAEKHCESKGATLVSVESEQEQEFLNQFVESVAEYHLGLRRRINPAVWYWIDGSPVVYTNWFTEQPDGSCDNEREICYTQANFGETGKWDDIPMTTRLTVCKKKLRKAEKKSAQHETRFNQSVPGRRSERNDNIA